MPTPWNDDPPGSRDRIRSNLEALLGDLIAEADRRLAPSVDMARAWHRRIFDGVELPVPYYAGEIRDDDPRYPELIDYEVRIGADRGVPARRVPEALEAFEEAMKQGVDALDDELPIGTVTAEGGVLGSILTLCANAHGEWARIHPFANGNGRTARLWANWCAVRYGLPPFVRLRPRPAGHLYASAAADSMQGNHRATVSLFTDWLHLHLEARGSSSP